MRTVSNYWDLCSEIVLYYILFFGHLLSHFLNKIICKIKKVILTLLNILTPMRYTINELWNRLQHCLAYWFPCRITTSWDSSSCSALSSVLHDNFTFQVRPWWHHSRGMSCLHAERDSEGSGNLSIQQHCVCAVPIYIPFFLSNLL